MSSKCRGCGGECASQKRLVRRLLAARPTDHRRVPDSISADPDVEGIRALMGETGTSTRKIWSAIRTLEGSSSTSWIYKKTEHQQR